MTTLSTGILVLFAVATLVAFAFPFFKEGAYKQITWVPEWSAVKSFAAMLFPCIALMAIGQCLKIDAGETLRYLALGAAVPFILTRLNIAPRLVGVLLLALSVLLTAFLKDTAAAPQCYALVAGLVVWKATENLLIKSESTLEDILPPLIWLVGLNWVRTVLGEASYATREGLLLGTLAVVLLLRIFETPFLADDKLYIKRIILAASGGLGVLIVITKLIPLPIQNSICPIAGLIGAGMFLAYLFDTMLGGDEQKYGPSEAVTVLVVTGILALVATRIFGNYGLIALAPAMLVGRNGFARQAALFFVARGFLQGYTNTYVQNVTGVNLLHAYSSAALFAGILIVAALSVALRDLSDRRWLGTIYLATGALCPLFSNYFLHEEPTASLLISAVVAGLMLCVLGPVIYRQALPVHENLLLLPVQMTSFALLGGQLATMGNEGTGEEKVKILLYCAVALLLVSGLLYWLFTRSPRKPVEVSGN